MPDEPHIYEAAGRVLCRKCFCPYCITLRGNAVAELAKGPRAVLKTVAKHQGMICSCVESMMETAREALAN